MKKQVYTVLYFLILAFLALPVIKLGPARVEQLLVLGTFALLFLDDTVHKEIDFNILVFLVLSALLLILISMRSPWPKAEEYNYYIKFLILYPVSFYVGARAVQKLGIETIIKVFDAALWFYFISWAIIMYVPLPMSILSKIVHLREFGWGAEFLPIQGTFYEAGALGIIVGTILTFSVLARWELNIWPKNRYQSYLLYTLVLYMIIMSKNKTVWLAWILMLFFMVFYKLYLMLTRTNYYYPPWKLKSDPILYRFLKLRGSLLMGSAFLLIVVLFVYNSVAAHPFITMEEFQYKMQHERGAQFAVSWDLIVKSNFFGGYGFGFVQEYFKDLGIMGVGGDSGGSINSVFLDMWLQGSIIGVIYLFFVHYIAFSNRTYLTMAIPLYLFFFGLTNPIVAEEFYLFLGLSYALARLLRNDEVFEELVVSRQRESGYNRQAEA